ncbi:hypothetical protein V5799_018576 [Amblyomma americanum]|uniref:Metalloendopeptidase OMA1, mitochondrial n=1 Tax=Amblyomma americanum TaxID=6943 RepID=A0AAQ4EZY2_AMBAM
MDAAAPDFVRGAFRLLNTFEGIAQLATLLATCIALKWVRTYTLQFSARRASVVLTVMFFGLVCYYVGHLEKQCISNRRRFVAYTPEQFTAHVSTDIKMIQRYFWLAARKPSKHGNYRRLNRVSQAIIDANKDLPGGANRTWSFVIVRSMTPSAFVLPNCRTYVFDGLFKICENDDTLSFVVAHEMAHCLLDHTLEKESLSFFLDKLNTLVWISSLTLVRGDVKATLVPWFVSRTLHYAVFLPQSRSMEIEADTLALQMIAKACFDFRYSIAYFDNAMTLRKRTMRTRKTRKLMSTHPTRRERVRVLYSQMGKAMELHKARNCPPLPQLRKNDKARIATFLSEVIGRRNK